MNRNNNIWYLLILGLFLIVYMFIISCFFILFGVEDCRGKIVGIFRFLFKFKFLF